jgi:hypothetical protein
MQKNEKFTTVSIVFVKASGTWYEKRKDNTTNETGLRTIDKKQAGEFLNEKVESIEPIETETEIEYTILKDITDTEEAGHWFE